MNKKGSKTTVAIVFLIIILLIVGGFFLIKYGKSHGWFKSEKAGLVSVPSSYFLIEVVDSKTKEKISSDITVRSLIDSSIVNGKYQSGVLTEVGVTNGTYLINGCMNLDNYYTQLHVAGIGEDKRARVSVECEKVEINPIISHIGELKEGSGVIGLNITAENRLRSVFMCLDWDIGIVKANFENKVKLCDSGDWVKCMKYDEKGEECLQEFPNNFYLCGNSSSVAQCKTTDKNMCDSLDIPIPSYIDRGVNSCKWFDTSIVSESKIFNIDYKTFNLRKGDCITVYIGDGDYDLSNLGYWEKETFFSKYLFFVDKKDIKAPTFKYKICYP